MVLNVVCRDAELDAHDLRWVEELSMRLERYLPGLMTVSWDLTHEGNGHLAVCRLHAGQSFYRASARARDARQAMHAAVDKLLHQRRRDKKIAGSARRETPFLDLPHAPDRATLNAGGVRSV